ncbi:MAG: metallophosphoesterase [Candidatus Magasanikbacteria bacterium]
MFGTAIILWGSFVEPKIIVINRQEIDLAKIDKPIKIAFISDLHVGPYKKADWVKKVVKKILDLKPDIVLIGGDNLYNSDYNPEELNYLTPLAELAKQIPTYDVNGNHEHGIGDGKSWNKNRIYNADWSVEIQTTMKKLGIHYLVNDLNIITVNNQSFYLFGGDCVLANKLDLSILDTRTEDLATIALIHNPLFLFIGNYPNIDLTLSGHTHGGQIRLPFFGPIGRIDDLIPTNFYEGLHNLSNGNKIFVTSGVGESGPRARLFDPPEIVLITVD